MRNSVRLVVVLAAVCLVLPALRAVEAAPAEEPGDLWQVTTTMKMAGAEGMVLPPRTFKVCSAHTWSKPPVGEPQGDKDCKTTDFSTSGATSTWKVVCAGPPPVSGEGTVTRKGADAYSGTMTMHSPDGTMTMTYDGKRIGDCDAAETKRQNAAVQARASAMQQQAADAQKQACESSVESMSLMLLTMPETPCTDPAYKTRLCARFETREGYEEVAGRADTPGASGMAEISKYCGKDPATVLARLCTEAAKSETLDFLGKHCPAEAKVIAQRECAGRDYTTLSGSKYYDFCRTYAEQSGVKAEPKDKKAASKKDKAKKALKGLFGR